MLITWKTAIIAPTLTLGGRKIDYVNQIKFLGCIIDRNLSWNPHIGYTKAACIRRLNVMESLTRTSWGSRAKFQIKFYKKCTRSKFEYAEEIYQSAPQSTLKRLDTIQNSALRISFGARNTTSKPFLLSKSKTRYLYHRQQKKNAIRKIFLRNPLNSALSLITV